MTAAATTVSSAEVISSQRINFGSAANARGQNSRAASGRPESSPAPVAQIAR